MGLSIKEIETVSCDNCNTVIPESNYTKEYVVVEQHKEKSWDLDHEWWETDVYRYEYHYNCPKCNKQGWICGENKCR